MPLSPLDLIGLITVSLLGVSMAGMLLYALHSLWLLYHFRRNYDRALQAEADELATPLPPESELPRVLIQLPVFNERDVASRVIEAACRLDWPRHLLSIQVLDDSTDDTTGICQATVDRLAADGHDIVLLHREDRTGFKAGALQEAMACNDAPFIAIFDADFIPHPDFIQRAIRPFLTDPKLAVVQGRWEHLNPRANPITRAQHIGLDGHFGIEQAARAWARLPQHFNGTCGMWRREAIDAAGGWQHETITEDIDLSYRALLAGYHNTYRMGMDVPGELPEDIDSWRNQQFRWAKGSTQVAKKLLGRVWASDWSLRHKFSATMHMTHYWVNALVVLSLVVGPLALWLMPYRPMPVVILSVLAIALGMFASFSIYIHSQRRLRSSSWKRIFGDMPVLAAMGTGLALSNTRGVIEAFAGVASPFVRTPKKGSGAGSYRASTHSGIPECFAALWALLGQIVGITVFAPIFLVFISGFAWVGVLSLRNWWQRTIRPAIAHPPGPDGEPLVRRAWLHLGVVALLSLGCYLLLAAYPGNWRDAPLLFTGVGLALGVLYLAAVTTTRLRPHGRGTFLIITIAALAFRLTTLGPPLPWDQPQAPAAGPVVTELARKPGPGIEPGAMVGRYIVEGSQVRQAVNPYALAPDDPERLDILNWEEQQAAGAFIEKSLNVDRDAWDFVDAPGTLLSATILAHASPNPWVFKLAAFICEAIALSLVIGMLVRRYLPPALCVALAWNPLGPLFLTGQGNLAALAILLLALGLAWSEKGRPFGSAVSLTLAALVKPIIGFAMLVRLPRWNWRICIVPLVILAAAYIPLIHAGAPLVTAFGDAGTAPGVLIPLLRALLDDPTLEPGQLDPVITAALASFFVLGSVLIVYFARRLGDDDPAMILARLYALLVICLPTFAPWQLAPLVLLLPFTRSFGFMLWTAMAPAYWLYGLQDGSAQLVAGGQMIDPMWITVLAHAPGLGVVGWEVLGRPGRSLLPGTANA